MTGGVNHQTGGFSLVVDKTIASRIHQQLADGDYINNHLTIKDLGSQIAIPVKNPAVIANLAWFDEKMCKFERIELETKQSNKTPAQDIAARIEKLLQENSLQLTENMAAYLPNKWELFGDLALVPSDTLVSSEWDKICSENESLNREIWQVIADSLKVVRIGRQSEIAKDELRSSQVKLIIGKSGEVDFTDNGVKFWLDVTKVMFSSGNVSERHRIGDIDMTGEVVVDAFSGIGYYTLPMLVRSKAEHVYACELNPNSIVALAKGAELNNVTDKLTIIEGDNEITLRGLTGIADRVHLGILPSSRNIWPLAIDCLKQTGGMLHVHMNVKEIEIDSFVDDCVTELQKYANHRGFTNIKLVHVEKVKWYAPHIRHLVLDVSIS